MRRENVGGEEGKRGASERTKSVELIVKRLHLKALIRRRRRQGVRPSKDT